MKKTLSKKLLGFALACALLTLAVAPSTFAAASTATVTVGNNNTLSLALNGDHLAPAFSGVLAFTPAQSSTISLTSESTASGDWMRVVDYTGTGSGLSGHHVNIALDTGTWTYGGGIAGTPNLTIRSTSAVGVNQSNFRLIDNGGTRKASSLDTGVCTVDLNEIVYYSPTPSSYMSKTSSQIVTNTEACAGTSWYTFGQMKFKGPSNRLSPGAYSVNATVTLVDGQ
jgi:hypothetical protein